VWSRLDVDLARVAAGLVAHARVALEVAPGPLEAGLAYHPWPRWPGRRAPGWMPLVRPRGGVETFVLEGERARVMVSRLGFFPVVEAVVLAVSAPAGIAPRYGVLTAWPHRLIIDVDGGGPRGLAPAELEVAEAALHDLLTGAAPASAPSWSAAGRFRAAWERPLRWLCGEAFAAAYFALLGV
jgi:hypothetical protein